MKFKNLAFFTLIIFFLNLIWEFSHYRLYNDLTGISPNLHLVLASFVDVLLIGIILFFVSLKNNKLDWIESSKRRDYFLFILSAISLAFIWELINLKLERWAYTATMPLFFGVGLTPILQLAITGTISLYIFSKLIKH